ncbi:tRNA pseudouridine(38-40) synthase TruA [Lutispora sp.]|uniref:tRNA pseudouridine(38-40) synthase TruA n=1 Tax=Lutispora sp. TaxID=2828727 RepID=UPI0035677722
MRNIRIIIEYDGTNYSGWQIQKNAPSIQEEIQKSIKKITGEDVNLIGAGRTDAGVHAKGQTANFITGSRVPADKFAWALNSVLQKDIVIKSSEEASLSFHSRYDAKSKIYSYTIHKGLFPPAIMRNYVYHVNFGSKIDMEKMKRAADCFVGTHDFKAFMATGSNVINTIRTIYSIKIEENEEYIRIFYHGNGFLYNMVRIITGTIIYASIGKMNADNIPEIIKKGDRELAGITVPAHGLCLEKVYYD